MPAIQEVVSAMVCGHEQAASTTNGAARVHEGKHHRGHGPLLPTSTAGAAGAGHARDARAEETKHLCQHLSALKGKRVEKLTAPKSVCINLA